MADHLEGWDIDRIENQEAAKIYECAFCLGLAKNPKMCSVCEHCYCSNCLRSYGKASCPLDCPGSTFLDVPKIILRTINEMKIHCRFCNYVFQIDQIDKHEANCQKPKCACPDCEILTSSIRNPHIIGDQITCSAKCTYILQTLLNLDAVNNQDDSVKSKMAKKKEAASELRKTFNDIINDPEVRINLKSEVKFMKDIKWTTMKY